MSLSSPPSFRLFVALLGGCRSNNLAVGPTAGAAAVEPRGLLPGARRRFLYGCRTRRGRPLIFKTPQLVIIGFGLLAGVHLHARFSRRVPVSILLLVAELLLYAVYNTAIRSACSW